MAAPHIPSRQLLTKRSSETIKAPPGTAEVVDFVESVANKVLSVAAEEDDAADSDASEENWDACTSKNLKVTGAQNLSASGGFAFIQYWCRDDAARAMASVNGTEIGGRPIAVDWAADQKAFLVVLSLMNMTHIFAGFSPDTLHTLSNLLFRVLNKILR